MTCWRRLRDWQEAGIWQLIHFVLLDWPARYGQVDWSRAVVDGSSVRPVFGGFKQVPTASLRCHHPELIALTFIRAHVTSARILRVVTRLAALIGRQQMALPVSAATRPARINRRASRGQSHGLGRSAVVL